VLINSPSGFTTLTFTVPQPFNLVAGDFVEDGHPDLAVVSFDLKVRIMAGAGNGSMSLFGTYPLSGFEQARSIVTDDFNGDEIADLFVQTDTHDHLLLGQGTGGVGNGLFSNSAQGTPYIHWCATTGDFNSDGNVDLATAGANPVIVIRLGNGSGAFGQTYITVTGNNGNEIISADVDGDGNLDLVTPGFDVVRVLWGNGNGTFTIQNIPATCTSVAVADFTGDGAKDLVVGHLHGVELYRATAPRTWAPADPYF